MFRIVASVLLFAFALAAGTQRAQAQLPIGYVSSAGVDTNDCSQPIKFDVVANLGPCRTFTRMLEQVQDGGVGICADAGSFGLLSIRRAITIDCRAGSGGQNASGIAVDAPGKRVHLRNLSVTAVSLVVNPVIFFAAESIELDNVAVSAQNVSGSDYAALYDRRAGPATLSIRNSSFGSSSEIPGRGIVIYPQGGRISAILDNVTVRNSTYGLAAASGARIMINRSTFSQNSVTGVHADSGVVMEINETLVSNNATGVSASAGSTVALSNSRINSNNFGINGPTISYGNNRFFANAASDGTPPTPAGLVSTEAGLK